MASQTKREPPHYLRDAWEHYDTPSVEGDLFYTKTHGLVLEGMTRDNKRNIVDVAQRLTARDLSDYLEYNDDELLDNVHVVHKPALGDIQYLLCQAKLHGAMPMTEKLHSFVKDEAKLKELILHIAHHHFFYNDSGQPASGVTRVEANLKKKFIKERAAALRSQAAPNDITFIEQWTENCLNKNKIVAVYKWNSSRGVHDQEMELPLPNPLHRDFHVWMPKPGSSTGDCIYICLVMTPFSTPNESLQGVECTIRRSLRKKDDIVLRSHGSWHPDAVFDRWDHGANHRDPDEWHLTFPNARGAEVSSYEDLPKSGRAACVLFFPQRYDDPDLQAGEPVYLRIKMQESCLVEGGDATKIVEGWGKTVN